MTKDVPAVQQSESEQVQSETGIPFWNPSIRGIPNAFARSALFGIFKDSERKTFSEEVKLSSVKGVEIFFKGKQLDQVTDLSVWLELVTMSLKEGDDELMYFKPMKFVSLRELLKKLGKSTGGNNEKWLKASLQRLQNGIVRITDANPNTKKKRAFTGNFIPTLLWEGDTPQLIKINPDLAEMFLGGHTRINKKERNMFGRDALALWLHTFYSSHKDSSLEDPYNYSAKTIKELCGSNANDDLYAFRKSLKLALKKLELKIGWKCKLNSKDAVVLRKNSDLVIEADTSVVLTKEETEIPF